MRPEIKRELKKGIIVMLITFVWGILLLFIVSALLGKFYIWHLSWNLMPIMAFLAGMIYDIKHEKIPDVDVGPKEIWEELGEDKVTIIREASPTIQKRYTGIY